jgi:hypothetical protein
MIVENLTGYYLYFGSYSLAPGESETVPDLDYNKDNLLGDRINSMFAAGTADVSSPPSGFPREIDLDGDSSSGGGGSPGGGGGEFDPSDTGTDWSIELFDTYA